MNRRLSADSDPVPAGRRNVSLLYRLRCPGRIPAGRIDTIRQILLTYFPLQKQHRSRRHSSGTFPMRRRSSCRFSFPSLSTSSRIHWGSSANSSFHRHIICITPGQSYGYDLSYIPGRYKKIRQSIDCRILITISVYFSYR